MLPPIVADRVTDRKAAEFTKRVSAACQWTAEGPLGMI